MVITDNDIFSFSSLLHLPSPPRKSIWATDHHSICSEEGMSQNLAVTGRRGKNTTSGYHHLLGFFLVCF